MTINLSKVDATGFPGVSIEFSAWDLNGIPLVDLKPEDVFIREDDGAEIHPASLEPDADAVLSVALVMDVSGSMTGQPLADAKNAANRFLDKLNPKDQAAVIAFSEGVNSDPAALDRDREVGFSNDLTGAFNLIEGLTAGGGTEVYNAVEKAVGMTSKLNEGHRAVLLFTDGKNEPAEVGDVEKAISLAKEANIPIFAIGLGNEIDEVYLTRLTGETGGMYRLTPHSSELSSLFNQMAALLKTTYTMTYQSGLAADGQEHTLNLRIVSKQGEGTIETGTGVLPKAAATATADLPTPTMEPSPTAAPAQAAASAAPPASLFKDKWYWLVVILIPIVAGAVIVRNNRRRRRVFVEKCGLCGAELTEAGPCPMCQSTKRIKVKK
ncbi:MAG: VWA domain-containing protein [Anaerolineaceae bacterium]